MAEHGFAALATVSSGNTSDSLLFDAGLSKRGLPEALEGHDMHRLDWLTMALSVGLFAAVMFASCVVYGLVVPSRLHAARVLEVILPGFRWLNVESVALGLGETFLYGAYAGLVFAWIHNLVAAKIQA